MSQLGCGVNRANRSTQERVTLTLFPVRVKELRLRDNAVPCAAPQGRKERACAIYEQLRKVEQCTDHSD